MKMTLLDLAGSMLALIFGVIVTYCGGINYLILFLVFLFSSVVVTKYGYEEKREIGLYEHERSWENVFANGFIPTICAVLTPFIGWAPYACSIAAITADKFASELGVLGSDPVSILTLKKTKKGKSGAVSPLGTLTSFDGALLVGIAVVLIYPNISLWTVLFIALIGFIGSFVDTIFGILEERGIGNKSTTNIICSIAGALLGFLLM
jgi:uncharacterized protein (TIGR00297 family)